MDKNTILLIFILFLLSSQLLSITWDIGKASLYIVIILLILNNISPETATIIKNIFSRIINLDSSLITGTLASISKFILGIFFKNKNFEIIDEVKNALKGDISSKLNIISEKIIAGEQILGEQIAGKQIAGKQIAGKQIAGKQIAGEQLSDEQILDEQILDLQTLDEQILDKQISDEIKSQSSIVPSKTYNPKAIPVSLLPPGIK